MYSTLTAGLRMLLLGLALLGLAAMTTVSVAQEAPDEAARLITKLKDVKPETRLAALVKLERYVREPRVVRAIAGMVADTNPKIHQMVAKRLAESLSPLAVEALIKLLKDPNAEIRDIAINALADIGDPRAVDPLLAMLKTAGPEMRGKIAYALGNIGDLRAVPALLAEIQRDDDQISQDAVAALGLLADPQAVEPLLAIARDTRHLRSVDAVQALGNMHEERLLDILLPRLTTPSDDELQLSIDVLAAGRIGDPLAVEPLLALLRQNRRTEVVLPALAALGDARAVEPICAYLATPAEGGDSEIRARAATALGVLGDRRAVPQLLALANAKEDAYDVRPAAINALGLLGDEAAIPTLTALVTEKDGNFRECAVRALGNLRHAKAYDVLAPLVQDIMLYSEALYALAKTPDARAITLVQQQLTARNEFSSSDWELADLVRELAANPACTTDDLIALSKTEDGVMRWERYSILLALAHRDDPAARRALVSCLVKNNSSEADAELLAALLPHAAEVTDLLLAALEFNEMQSGDIALLLARLGDPRAEAALLPLVDNFWARDGVLEGLGYLKSRQALPILLAAATGDPQRQQFSKQRGAIRGLGLLGDAQAVDTLLAIAKAPGKRDEDAMLRAEALTALGRIGDTRAHDVLLAALTGDREDDRQAALTGLANYPLDDTLTRAVLAALPQCNGDAFTPAVQALSRVPGPQVTDALIRQLRHGNVWGDEDVTSVLATALSARNDPRAITALIATLDEMHEHPRTRVAILHALAATGDPRGVLPAMQLLRDTDIRVRAAAADTLHTLTGQTFGPDHAAWVAWYVARPQ